MKIYLSNGIQKSTIWNDRNRWDSLWIYINQKNGLEKLSKNRNRDSSKEKKDGFLNKIKNIGKNISIEFNENQNKLSNASKSPKRSLNPLSNRDSWFSMVSKSINLQCIEELNNIFHAIDLDPREASEILIFLHKKYQIKVNDILPLVESQQKRFVQTKYESNLVFNKKRKSGSKLAAKSKQLFAIVQAISYLDPFKDSLISLLLVNKDWNKNLSQIIYEKCLNFFHLNQKYKIKIWIKILNPVAFLLKFY